MTQTLHRLWLDPFARCGLFIAAALPLIYFWPTVAPSFVERFDEHAAEPLLILFVLFAVAGTARGARFEERRFWNYLSAAFVCFFISEVLHLFESIIPAAVPSGLLWDVCYLVLYLFAALAAETRPHRKPGWSLSHPEYRFGLSGSVVFAFGMLSYFVLIPQWFDARAYDTLLPSYLLYVGLDLYLALRFAVLARSADSARWQFIYGLLSLAAGLWACTDVLEALNVSEVIFIGRSSPLALLWYPPYFVAAAAARFGALSSARSADADVSDEESDFESQFVLTGGPLIAGALAFPIMHFGLYAAGVLSPSSKPARESLVLILIAVLGTLAMALQRLHGARHQRLSRDLKRSRTELERAQRLESIGRLAGGVAHDFNNLLTAIQGSTELVRKQRPYDVGADRLFATIETATTQARGLTQQLLAFGRKQHLSPKVVSLNGLVAESDDLLAGILGPRIRRRAVLNADPGRVEVDPLQVGQVLLNLAANARDAMDGKGEFTVCTRDLEYDGESSEHPPDLDAGRYVVLEARDTGVGMDLKTMDEIFEPFFTTKERHRGTGLGLASVYGAIKQSGGSIRVESEPGRGSNFVIYFPRAEPPLETWIDVAAQSPRPHTILVVDDEPAVLSVVAELLECAGYRVLTASNGGEALETAAGQAERIDLLLTDVAMPVMDGVELVRRMAVPWPETRVLFMSGYSGRQELVQRAMASGTRLIQKPFTCEGLLEEVESVFRRGSGHRSGGLRCRVVCS